MKLKIMVWARRIVMSSVLIYKLICLLQKRLQPLANYTTDLVLEGYPRSGNSFAYHIVKNVNPSLKIGHHTHSIVNIKIAIKMGIPIFVILRDPIDAVASFVLRRNEICGYNNEKNIAYAISDYYQFYNFVMVNKKNTVIIPFDTLVEEPKEFLSYFAKRGLIDYKAFNKTNADSITKKAFTSLGKHENSTKPGVLASGIPNVKRTELKKQVIDILKSHYSNDMLSLNGLYVKLMNYGTVKL